jgi:flagellar protein FlaG
MNIEALSSNQMWPMDYNFTSSEQSIENTKSISDAFGTDALTKVVKNTSENKSDNISKNASEKALNEVVKNVNRTISNTETRLEISIFKPTHELQVKIKDSKTGKVIREIPSQKMLELAAYMRGLAGIFVDTRI